MRTSSVVTGSIVRMRKATRRKSWRAAAMAGAMPVVSAIPKSLTASDGKGILGFTGPPG